MFQKNTQNISCHNKINHSSPRNQQLLGSNPAIQLEKKDSQVVAARKQFEPASPL